VEQAARREVADGRAEAGGHERLQLRIAGTGAHLEFTAGGGHGAPAPHPGSLLVRYLGDDAAVQTVAAHLRVDPVPPANPYWAGQGLTFEDPDGFRVVLMPERWENEAGIAAVPIQPETGSA
jgi:hypothetical protein